MPRSVRVASVTPERAWSARRRFWIKSHQVQLSPAASHRPTAVLDPVGLDYSIWPGQACDPTASTARTTSANRQIERALNARNQAHRQTASGSANRRYRPHPVRHMSVDGPRSRARAGTREALHTRNQDSTPRSPATVSAAQSALGGQPQASRGVPWTTRIWPTYGPQWSASGLPNRLFSALEPLTQVRVNGSDLGFCVAGVGFEPT